MEMLVTLCSKADFSKTDGFETVNYDDRLTFFFLNLSCAAMELDQ